MSLDFSTTLVHHFEPVSKWTEECSNQLKEVLNFFKRKQQIELDYAKALAKLCATSREVLPVEKRIPVILEKDRAQDTGGSLLTTFYNVIEETAQFSVSQEEYSSQMTAHIVDSLTSYLKNFEASRKQLIAEGARETKVLQDSFMALKKAQSAYNIAKKEAEEAESNYEKAKNNHLSKEKDVAKLRAKAESATDKGRQCFEMLEQCDSECRLTQELYYRKLMPRILKFFEKKDDERCKQILTSFNAQIAISKEKTNQMIQYNHRLQEVVESTDVRCDLQEFVRRHAEGDNVVSVRSLLNPVKKGRLQLVRNVFAGNRAKEYFFVLMGDQRRLYMFDSEDSTKPRDMVELPDGQTELFVVHESLFGVPNFLKLLINEEPYYLCSATTDDFKDWVESFERVLIPEDVLASRAQGERIIESLSVQVADARGLAKSGDYFVLMSLDNLAFARTQTKSNSTVPNWMEKFELDNFPSSKKQLILTLCNERTSVLNRQMEVGQVAVTIRDFEPDKASELWFPIVNGDEGICNLRMTILYKREHILTMNEYEPFLKLLETQPIISWSIGQVVLPKDRDELGHTLLLAMLGRDRALEYLCQLCAEEVESTDDVGVLFRGNTIATKCVDSFLHLVGHKYLQNTLQAMIRQICESKSSCEVDPSRLSNAADLRPNWKRLLTHLNNTWTAVLFSLDKCPLAIKALFQHIQQAIIKKFGENSLPRHTGVGSFYFLRFICPAVLSPKKFDLIPYTPDEASARTLKLIAKTLQNLANLQPFGVKETYMMEMNDFITANKNMVRQAIDKLSSGVPKGKILITTSEKIDLPRAAGRLHSYMRSNYAALREKAGKEGEEVMNELSAILQIEDTPVPASTTTAAPAPSSPPISTFVDNSPASLKPTPTTSITGVAEPLVVASSAQVWDDVDDEGGNVPPQEPVAAKQEEIKIPVPETNNTSATTKSGRSRLASRSLRRQSRALYTRSFIGQSSPDEPTSPVIRIVTEEPVIEGEDEGAYDEVVEQAPIDIEVLRERLRVLPAVAIVEYSYDAERDDELSVREEEVVLVIASEYSAGEGWVVVQIPARDNATGHVPLTYLQVQEYDNLDDEFLEQAGIDRAVLGNPRNAFPLAHQQSVDSIQVDESGDNVAFYFVDDGSQQHSHDQPLESVEESYVENKGSFESNTAPHEDTNENGMEFYEESFTYEEALATASGSMPEDFPPLVDADYQSEELSSESIDAITNLASEEMPPPADTNESLYVQLSAPQPAPRRNKKKISESGSYGLATSEDTVSPQASFSDM